MPGATAPQRLGRFEISSHLATGGMAEIYLARAPGLRDPVVVKVITRDRATDDKFIQMFLDEARVIATLNHPNIARLLEIGKDGQVYFLAMEFVRGETVRAVLEKCARSRQPIPHGVVLGIAQRVAQALHHAHDRKGIGGNQLEIVHRDVTPSNVMVGSDGVVKLLDFGVARAKGRSQETVSGTVKGKFAYMAPEQCLGKKVDRRADVFSLGILMYEMATLRRAFRAESDYDTLTKIVQGDIAAPSTLVKNFPPAFEELIQKAMAIDLEQRFQSAAEIGAAIEEVAWGLGGLAGPAELAAFMRERFPTSANALTDPLEDEVVIERVEPARSRPITSSPIPQPQIGRAPTGPIPSFSPALVPAPPREQRATGANALFPPQGTPVQPAPLPSSTPVPPEPARRRDPTPMPMVARAPTPAAIPPVPAASPVAALAGHSDWSAGEKPDDPGISRTMMGHLAPIPVPSSTPVPATPRSRPPSVNQPGPGAKLPTPVPFTPTPAPPAAPLAASPSAAPLPASASPVALPPPPEPDRGLPWALPVALVAIGLVTAAIVAIILLT